MLTVEFYLNELTGEAEPVIVDLTEEYRAMDDYHRAMAIFDDLDLPF